MAKWVIYVLVLCIAVIVLGLVLGYRILKVEGEQSDYLNRLGRIIGMDAVVERGGVVDLEMIPSEMRAASIFHGYRLVVNNGHKISLDSKSTVAWGFYVPTKVDVVYGAFISNRIICLAVFDDLHVARLEVGEVMDQIHRWRDAKTAQQVDSAEASTIAVPPSKPSGSPR